MFWKKRMISVNVGKAIVLITFTDNSSEVVEIYGERHAPAKFTARRFMDGTSRKDYKVFSDGGNKLTYKDIRCIEITSLHSYVIEYEK